MQRQQHGRLEAVHVLRRHRADDAGRGPPVMPKRGRGIGAAFDERPHVL